VVVAFPPKADYATPFTISRFSIKKAPRFLNPSNDESKEREAFGSSRAFAHTKAFTLLIFPFALVDFYCGSWSDSGRIVRPIWRTKKDLPRSHPYSLKFINYALGLLGRLHLR